MAKINRKYIDKHWLVFLFRGALAATFGCFALFTRMASLENVIAIISVFLLLMGIIDAVGALYCSTKKHGWFNAVVDAAIDVAAALTLLFSVDLENALAGLLEQMQSPPPLLPPTDLPRIQHKIRPHPWH